jgi:hypothetical protein
MSDAARPPLRDYVQERNISVTTTVEGNEVDTMVQEGGGSIFVAAGTQGPRLLRLICGRRGTMEPQAPHDQALQDVRDGVYGTC